MKMTRLVPRIAFSLLLIGCGSSVLGRGSQSDHGGAGSGGMGGCSDWGAGEGGTECGSPVVTAVDSDTGAVICDPSFAVKPVSSGETICHPTGDPLELEAFDGAATCTFSLQSLNGITIQVEVQVVAPGYAPSVVSLGPCKRDATYVAALVPIGDAGLPNQDASGYPATNCKVDDTGDDCTTRGLHRYVCPANEPIEPAGCSPTGELDMNGTITRCCP
jgi:hypothetical protein